MGEELKSLAPEEESPDDERPEDVSSHQKRWDHSVYESPPGGSHVQLESSPAHCEARAERPDHPGDIAPARVGVDPGARKPLQERARPLLRLDEQGLLDHADELRHVVAGRADNTGPSPRGEDQRSVVESGSLAQVFVQSLDGDSRWDPEFADVTKLISSQAELYPQRLRERNVVSVQLVKRLPCYAANEEHVPERESSATQGSPGRDAECCQGVGNPKQRSFRLFHVEAECHQAACSEREILQLERRWRGDPSEQKVDFGFRLPSREAELMEGNRSDLNLGVVVEPPLGDSYCPGGEGQGCHVRIPTQGEEHLVHEERPPTGSLHVFGEPIDGRSQDACLDGGTAKTSNDLSGVA